MSMVRNTVIVAAIVGSFAGMLLASGFERRSLMLAAAGIGPMLVFWFLMWYAITHIEYEREANRPRPKQTEAPAQTDGAHRGDKWETARILIHDWAANGLTDTGEGSCTSAQASKETAERSKLPFSSDIWGDARLIALDMRHNGAPVFATKRGKGGNQLVVVQRIPYGAVQQEWQRVAGKHMLRASDRRAAAY